MVLPPYVMSFFMMTSLNLKKISIGGDVCSLPLTLLRKLNKLCLVCLEK